MNPSLLNAMQKVADSKIKEAIDEGKFSRLEYFGKPLQLEIDQPDPHWWIRQKCKEENLSVLPPAMDLKKRTEDRLAEIEQMTDKREVVEALARLNQQIEISNRQILWGPGSKVIPIEIAGFLEKWQQKQSDQDTK